MLKTVQNLNKIELHRHFEGCISPKIFHKLITKNHPGSLYTDFNEIEKLYSFTDFMGFLETFAIVVNHVRHYDDFEILTKEIALNLKLENIIYTEFLFSPEPFREKGLNTKTILKIIKQTFDASNCRTGVIIDLVRQAGYESTMNCLLEIIEIRRDDLELKHWIKAISIGGNEIDYPAKLFKEHFNLAKKNGLYLYAHAGESVGNHSVWDAIDLLQVSRIGHGITSVADGKLINILKQRGIALDISISSNYFTGVAENDRHPVKELFDNGCQITLNTDDPGFFNTDLNKEYSKFLKMGYEIEDLEKVIENALKASFLTIEEKQNLSQLLN